jgi:zinc transport system permease protein
MQTDAQTLGQFFEAWDLFRDPALSGAVAGALLGWLGVYVVLGRMVFLSATLSQAAGLGVALSFWLGAATGLAGSPLVSPWTGSVVMTGLATLLLLAERNPGGVRREAVLGFAYLVGAAGTLAVGTRIAAESHDIDTLLFGTAVAVVPEDFRLLLLVATVLLAVHAWGVRGFVQAAFLPDAAQVRGLPVVLLRIVLFGSMAVAISVCTRVVGALPVFALSVLPATAATRLAPSVRTSLLLSAVIGAASGFAGYVAAFLWNLPVGASQTLIAALFVAAAFLAALPPAIKRRLTRSRSGPAGPGAP